MLRNTTMSAYPTRRTGKATPTAGPPCSRPARTLQRMAAQATLAPRSFPTGTHAQAANNSSATFGHPGARRPSSALTCDPSGISRMLFAMSSATDAKPSDAHIHSYHEATSSICGSPASMHASRLKNTKHHQLSDRPAHIVAGVAARTTRRRCCRALPRYHVPDSYSVARNAGQRSAQRRSQHRLRRSEAATRQTRRPYDGSPAMNPIRIIIRVIDTHL